MNANNAAGNRNRNHGTHFISNSIPLEVSTSFEGNPLVTL